MIKYDDDNDNDDNDDDDDDNNDDDDNDDEIEEQYKFQPKRLRGRKSQKTIAGALLLGLWQVNFIIIVIVIFIVIIITIIMIMFIRIIMIIIMFIIIIIIITIIIIPDLFLSKWGLATSSQDLPQLLSSQTHFPTLTLHFPSIDCHSHQRPHHQSHDITLHCYTINLTILHYIF